MKNYIRRCRLNMGLTQLDLANALGVRQSSVSRWELGEQIPSKEMAIKIRRYFGQGKIIDGTDSLLLFIRYSKTSLTLLDRNMQIKEVSEGLIKKRGYSRSIALGLNLKLYMTQNLTNKFERALSEGLLEDGQFCISFDSYMKTLEGNIVKMNIKLTPMLGFGFGPAILSETTDISDVEFSDSRFEKRYLGLIM